MINPLKIRQWLKDRKQRKHNEKKAARNAVRRAAKMAERQRLMQEAKLHHATEAVVESKTQYWQEQAHANRHLASAGERPRAIAAPIFKRIMSIIPPGSKILDVGAGHGRYSIPFAEAGHKVVATDVSQAMLDHLKANAGDIPVDVIAADARKLPAKDNEFDVVFSNDFMGHFPNWKELLIEQARCCKPGGMVITSLSLGEHRERIADWPAKPFEHVYIDELKPGWPYWVTTSVGELEEVGKTCGLRVEKLIPLKFFTDSYMFGRALGTDDYKQACNELRDKLRSSPELEEFYTWLELTFLQNLPPFASSLTLIVYRKC
ncbi:MAG: class I SAM-dependent methyltransferase [Verrucomicrobiaceae bacterium]|nr:class I SAM-dependent methyltransferase [Verrucomicrobiaceae bacterium]